MATMIKVYRVREFGGGNSFYTDKFGDIGDSIGDSDIGSEYTVTVEEMDQEKFDALAEFEGF